MEGKDKKNLHMVHVDWDEIEKKVHEHHMKQLKWILLVVCICVAALVAYFVAVHYKYYTSYRIVDQSDRVDTAATEYVEYNGGFLKYSNDGAIYTTTENETIWNQSFELQEPMVSICETYVAIADREGKAIYVMNEHGDRVDINVTMPIIKTEVASTGTLAVLMADDNSSYLAVYNKAGEQIAEGAIHVENGGTPMDIALSYDGKKLGVAILNFKDGSAQTTINFYNFGTEGQNEIDNIISTYDFTDTVIPEIAYVSDDDMIAFADTGIITFEGSEKPEQSGSVNIEDEIQSIFYNEKYMGVVVRNPETESDREVVIYNMNCAEVARFQTDLSYNTIGFLSNDEVCLYNEKECQIVKTDGTIKCDCSFGEDTLERVFHSSGSRFYIVVTSTETNRICLRLFDSATEEEDWTAPMEEVEDESETENTESQSEFDNSDDIYNLDVGNEAE